MDDGGAGLAGVMQAMGQSARAGARALRLSTPAMRTAAILGMAAGIRQRAAQILAANAADLSRAGANGLTAPMIERLMLDEARLEGVAKGIEAVAAISDPVGTEIARWTRPNG